MLQLAVITVSAFMVLAIPAAAGGNAPGPGSQVSETGYHCADGSAVSLTYLFDDQRPALAVMGSGGGRWRCGRCAVVPACGSRHWMNRPGCAGM